jgi:RNA recognition motif-containing protein
LNRTGDEGNAENDSTAAADAPTTNGTINENDNTPPKRRGGYHRRGRGRGRGRGGRINRRRPRNAGFTKTGEPSKTVVFVANLPFSINDDGLKEIFKDYNVSSAHVVNRRGGRSKGFGFVELADEEEQKKALEGLKDVESEGRTLVIKVALSDQHVQPVEDAEKSEAPISNDEKKETD